jgi:CBS domain-containing protein
MHPLTVTDDREEQNLQQGSFDAIPQSSLGAIGLAKLHCSDRSVGRHALLCARAARSPLKEDETMKAQTATTALTARQIMQKPVLATTARASARDIAAQLVRNEFSGMPVAERDGTVVGIVTEADILRALAEGRALETLTASDIMTAKPASVDVETPITEIIKILQEHRILRVPVTEREHLVGIISRSDIIRAVLEPEFMAF